MTSSSAANEGAARIAEEARDWAGLLLAGEPSDADRARFEAWLARSPAHKTAFERVERAWRALGRSDRVVDWVSEVEEAAPRPADRPGLTRRRAWSLGLGAAAAAATAWLAGPALVDAATGGRAEPRRYVSGVAETKTIALDDGTTVTLGGKSVVEVVYTRRSRAVALLEGSAFFDVARDESRPLTVDAGGSQIRVLGTEFGVRVGASDVSVVVSGGVVSVGAAGAAEPGAMRRVPAGRRVVADLSGAIVREEEADLQTDLSWVEGYFAYDGAPLSEVIDDINRYRVKQVRLDGDEISDLSITVSFRTDQADQFLSALPAAYPVTVHDYANATIVRPAPVAPQ